MKEKTTTRMPRIAAGWASFFDMVVPVGAGEEQRKQLKQAFYGGALILFNEIMHASTLTEIAGEKVLSEINDELQEFGRSADADSPTATGPAAHH